jgi:hypothetical protein
MERAAIRDLGVREGGGNKRKQERIKLEFPNVEEMKERAFRRDIGAREEARNKRGDIRKNDVVMEKVFECRKRQKVEH